MKKFFMGAAAAIAIAAPAHAATGYVGAGYQNVNVDPGSAADDDQGTLEASTAFELTKGIGMELDAGMVDGQVTDTLTYGQAHLYAKNDGYILGGFAGASDTTRTNAWNAGFEGQLYLDHATLSAAATYVNANQLDVDGWGTNLSGKYFFSDNFSVGANAGWFALDTGRTNYNPWIGGVGGEYQLASMPISFLLSYEHYDADTLNVTADTVSAGVRYNFGTTLKTRSTSGGDLASITGATAVLF